MIVLLTVIAVFIVVIVIGNITCDVYGGEVIFEDLGGFALGFAYDKDELEHTLSVGLTFLIITYRWRTKNNNLTF